jgi:thioredoxin 1
MNRAYRPLVVFAVVIGMALLYGWRSSDHSDDKIPWRKDLARARSEAVAAGKPVLVYFTATWCGPCQSMKRQTWTDPRVEAALGKVIPVKIDVDEQPNVARDFNVDGIPRLQLIRPDGSLGPAHVGFISADQLLLWLPAA